jgi:copper chaperone CopZ
MTKRILFIFGFILAVTVSFSFSHFPMFQAEGATHETTYVFHDLGMTTNEARQEVAKILDQTIGISKVEISPANDQVKMTIDQEIMKPEWVAKTLNANGYSPESYTRVKGQ